MTNFIPKIILSKIDFLTEDKKQIEDIYTFIDEWNNNSDFIQIKTSGSTGDAKKIVFKKKSLLASANATFLYFKEFSDSTLALCLSANTIAGKMQIIRSLLWKKRLLVLPLDRNPLKDLDETCSFTTFTPIQFKEIIRLNPHKLNLIENSLLGAAPIDQELFDSIKRVKTNVYQGFGMTETLSHFAIRKLNNTKDKNINDIPYTLLKNVELSENENYFYVDIPYLKIKKIKLNDDFLLLDSYNFLWLGRKDWLINSGGYKFHPEEIERKISNIIQNNYFIISEKNQEYFEIITLYIEDENKQIEIEDVKSKLSKVLTKYEMPKKVYLLKKFIYTESGKINRLITQKYNFEK